jgi:adenylosuccinate lyase
MTTHLIDSILYRHLWSTEELHRLLDEVPKVQAWLDILATLAEAQAEVGVVPHRAAEAIRQCARVERLDLREIATETRRTGHSTLGLIRCLQQVLPEHAREWVYFGATVQDLTDTWTALVMRDVTDIVLRDLSILESEALRLASEHRDTVMAGRTHGQPGLPITFGFKAAVWAAELRRHDDRIRQARPRWEVAQLGGALGTLGFWGEHALPLLSAFARRIGLAEPRIPWLTARDGVAEFVSVLAMVTATLGKIGQEVYELQRPEIGEVREARGAAVVGSITMPHKRNPECSEQLVTLSRLVRNAASSALEGMLCEHERDGRSWKCEWIVVPEACQFTGAAMSLGIQLLGGLEIDAQRMADNVAAGGGYIFSEPAMRALSATVGKHSAHEIVHGVTMQGQADRIDLVDALTSDSRVREGVTPEELATCMTTGRAVGLAPAFVDRVVQAASTRDR